MAMSKIMWVVLAAFLLTAFAWGCGPEEHTLTDGRIAGTVVDAVDRTPIDSARVLLRTFDPGLGKLYETERFTDANGRFSFGVKGGYRHVVEVSKNGYITVTLRAESGIDLEIALERTQLIDSLATAGVDPSYLALPGGS